MQPYERQGSNSRNVLVACCRVQLVEPKSQSIGADDSSSATGDWGCLYAVVFFLNCKIRRARGFGIAWPRREGFIHMGRRIRRFSMGAIPLAHPLASQEYNAVLPRMDNFSNQSIITTSRTPHIVVSCALRNGNSIRFVFLHLEVADEK